MSYSGYLPISLVGHVLAGSVSKESDRDFLVHRFAVGLEWVHVNTETECGLLRMLNVVKKSSL